MLFRWVTAKAHLRGMSSEYVAVHIWLIKTITELMVKKMWYEVWDIWLDTRP